MFLPKVKVELINPEDNIRFIRNCGILTELQTRTNGKQ